MTVLHELALTVSEPNKLESSVRSEPRLDLSIDGSRPLGAVVPTGIPRLPDYAIPLQPKLLKQINAMHTKEELLAFVGQCYIILDPINLVTCVYRLARMYTGIRHPEARQAWKAELNESSSFQVLLRTIQSHMLAAQLHPPYSQEVKGIDARCVSNLIWALVKLDLALEAGCTGNEVIISISPLVLRLLNQSSPQGLANLLWAYAKLAEPPVEVISSIMSQMTDMLTRDQTGSLFDAQALSNSIWAVAHARSKLANFDGLCGAPGSVSAFLVAIAISANSMLKALYTRLDLAHLSAFLNNVEHKFSCQALVNIVWSFATILGEECGQNPIISQLFLNSRKEAIIRLRATYAALQTQQSWVYHLPGGFNEQALSNVVYAYEKAGMLDRELLQWVFSVATLRLDRRDGPPSFKPQELCTLLRAAHLDICEPQPFLNKLARIVQTMPWIVRNWSPSELNELSRALGLLQPTLLTPHQAQAQQQVQQHAQVQTHHHAHSQAQQQAAAQQLMLQVNALTAAGMGMGGLPNGGVNTNLAAELLAAELHQMTIQNVLTAQLNAAAAAVAAGMSYGSNGASGSQTFNPNLPMGVPADPLQALRALQFSPATRPLGAQGLPPAPVSWP
ncbi:hypothetical protein VOLCADRAFT_118954 [Volvox carteri f. nagariensis]|uniref:Uncharacterized protein n=1 Tax=Volvox carteri f. nagariensis TaxID=3068 RepID=D8U8Y0_VOLCA|nr:uncharacterized protein VOLCADRAFT_118954 [Volvox carteri f. nagariensis]EFJ43826.1 hypothetical protein VOLCADRAFT_118954 [Volvox carteri f. nagariensis]|eukprot:XP_002955072.1 hypothetical protein VOLCADRAFT_118954 [Volvox carteri f. nagariensis]